MQTMKVFYLMAFLVFLSLGSCKQALTQEEGEDIIEVANSENDSEEADTDSLTDAAIDSKIKVERMKNKEVIPRKTKAQYVIY